MVRLKPELFLRFIILTGFISILWIAWVTIRHQQGKEADFASSMSQTFSTVVKDQQFLQFLDDVDSASIYPLESDLIFYVFWSPWSDKSSQFLIELDQRMISNKGLNAKVVALSVKESQANTLQKIQTLESSLESDVLWVEGTSLYGELAVPGIPTLLIYDQKDSTITSYVGVSNLDLDQWLPIQR
jgi:hypothetical protein